VIATIREGHIPVDQLITHRTRLADAVRDIKHWATDKSGLIKAIIEMG
jgi:threonine dehydrogenase-like Zn-dependent dehydrogenase